MFLSGFMLLVWTFLGLDNQEIFHIIQLLKYNSKKYSRLIIVLALLSSAYYKYQWKAVQDFHHGWQTEESWYETIDGSHAERITSKEYQHEHKSF